LLLKTIERRRWMRVATLFKRLLRLDGSRVLTVELVGEAGEEAVVVDVALPQRRKLVCPRCGFSSRASYNRTLRTFRHLGTRARTRRPALECARRRTRSPAKSGEDGRGRQPLHWSPREGGGPLAADRERREGSGIRESASALLATVAAWPHAGG